MEKKKNTYTKKKNKKENGDANERWTNKKKDKEERKYTDWIQKGEML